MEHLSYCCVVKPHLNFEPDKKYLPVYCLTGSVAKVHAKKILFTSLGFFWWRLGGLTKTTYYCIFFNYEEKLTVSVIQLLQDKKDVYVACKLIYIGLEKLLLMLEMWLRVFYYSKEHLN